VAIASPSSKAGGEDISPPLFLIFLLIV